MIHISEIVASTIAKLYHRSLNIGRYQSYADYLQSDHWQRLRLVVLSRAEYRCEQCGTNSKLDVHHKTYERLGHERLDDLIAVCRSCHTDLHR